MFVLKHKKVDGWMSWEDWKRTIGITVYFGVLLGVKLVYIDRRLK
jgi:hypothetical protein